jgi:hypothetical protein
MIEIRYITYDASHKSHATGPDRRSTKPAVISSLEFMKTAWRESQRFLLKK